MTLSEYDGEDVTVVYRRYIKVQVDVRKLENVRNPCHRVYTIEYDCGCSVRPDYPPVGTVIGRRFEGVRVVHPP